MCLTIPGKVIKINGRKALIKTPRELKWVKIDLISEVKIGDFILATTDLAVKKINKREAKEILNLLLGQKFTDLKSLSSKFKKIIKKAQIGELDKKDIVYLLKTSEKEKEALFSEADATRKENIKDFICLHGIIEFSNYCQNNCTYCGLRADNQKIKRYRMGVEEIVKIALRAVNDIGYKMLVLQSGVDLWYTDKMLVDIIKKIKAKSRCFIFMSVGERSVDCYKKMRQAGASGVLFRFETSNPKLYNELHKNKITQEQNNILKNNLSNRLRLLREMKKIGYYISTGSMIGLPGQTLEDLADDILLMKKLGVGMISMGPFVPLENLEFNPTGFVERIKPALGWSASGGNQEWDKKSKVEMTLKMIAISRLIMKSARLPVTTALETLDPKNARKKGLQSGANSLMFNLTPKKYRGKYEIYPNKFYGRSKDLEDFALYKGKESWEMLEREFREL